MDRLLLSIPELCDVLNVGRTMAYELIEEKQITRVKVGRRSFVTAESVRGYVNRLAEAALA